MDIVRALLTAGADKACFEGSPGSQWLGGVGGGTPTTAASLGPSIGALPIVTTAANNSNIDVVDMINEHCLSASLCQRISFCLGFPPCAG